MANEKRLIDANALTKSLEATPIRIATEKGKMFQLIENSHTVDAVEVVRCGCCKDWLEIAETGGAGYCNHPCWMIAAAEPPIVQFADFCSYGERKNNG